MSVEQPSNTGRKRRHVTWKAVVLGVLMGLALGLLVGHAIPASLHELIPATAWLRWATAWCCGVAFYLLPIWSLFAMRKEWGWLVAGFITFGIIVVFGVLLPVT